MSKDKVDMDLILAEVGHFGSFQFRLLLLIAFPVIFSAMYNAQYVFNAADIKYRCFVPECESQPGTFKAGPWSVWALVSGSSCTRYQPVAANCSEGSFSKRIQECEVWVYEHQNTIVAEFNLACKDWKRTLVGTMHSLGVFTTMIYIGIVSDTIGRQKAFITAACCSPVMGLIRSCSTSYVMYIIFEYLDSALGAGVYSTGFILLVEMVGNHKRVICGSIMASLFAAGCILLAFIAWSVPYWRTLTRILYTPPVMFLSYIFCLSESVRWLVSKKKIEKAIRLLKKVAKMNKRPFSEATINLLNRSNIDLLNASLKTSIWRRVLRSKIIITRVIICSFCWMTVTFTYYGISINAVSLMGNMYINYALTALVEIPGYFVTNFMLDRFGRKLSIMSSLLTCSFSLFLVPILPISFRIYPTLLAKTAISMTFVAIYIYTLELFPTSARHSLMAICSLIGRIGSVTAPLSPLLLKITPWLPYLTFGSMTIIAAILLIFVPETHHHPLPETISQAEGINVAPRQLTNMESTSTRVVPQSSPTATTSKATN